MAPSEIATAHPKWSLTESLLFPSKKSVPFAARTRLSFYSVQLTTATSAELNKLACMHFSAACCSSATKSAPKERDRQFRCIVVFFWQPRHPPCHGHGDPVDGGFSNMG
jgi:hypothetical protein